MEVLERGGLLAYPTDTYYGLGCDLSSKKGIERLYQLKGRDKKAFNRALHFTGDITEYAKIATRWDLSVLEALDDGQRAEIRNALRMIDGIHDKIATRI